MMIKNKIIMLLPLIGLVGPVMAIDAAGEISMVGNLRAPTCVVDSPIVNMGLVNSSSLASGSNEQGFRLRVRCDLTSSISAVTFTGAAVSSKPGLFAVTDSSGTSQPNGNVGLRLRVDTDQTAVWGGNADDDFDLEPGTNLLASVAAVTLAGSRTPTDMLLKVAMVTGHEGAGQVDVHGDALSTPINVAVTY